MMNRYAIVIVLSLTLFSFGGGVQAEPPPGHPEELWNSYVKGRPNPRVLDKRVDFEMIEGVQIIQQSSGLTALGAALGTVIFETGGVKVKDCAASPEVFVRLAEKMKGDSLSGAQKRAVEQLSQKASEEYWDRHPGVKGKVVFDKTFGIRDAKLLQMTFGKEDEVVAALRQVALYHGYVPTLERSDGLPFLTLKESIDKKVPVLLQGDEGKFRVAFGYLNVEGDRYVILANCADIPLEKRPMHITESERQSEDPWVMSMVERYKKKRITSDYETGNGKGKLVQGVKIVPFGQIKESTVYLIYNWRRSAEAWREEIIDIVGEPEGKTNEEE